MARSSKLTKHHDLVGTVPDREVAAKAGVSIATVCHYRQRHNIPSYRSRIVSGGASAAPAAPPPQRATSSTSPATEQPSDELGGYRATIQLAEGTADLIVVATDIVEAATKATSKGRVIAVTYLAPAVA